MSGTADYYNPGGRRDRNEHSREEARNYHAPWTGEDDEFIVEFWINDPARDEEEIARALSRTIEACRNRSQMLRGTAGGQQVRRVTTTNTYSVTHGNANITRTKSTVTDYIGANDDPEDRWWDPTGKEA